MTNLCTGDRFLLKEDEMFGKKAKYAALYAITPERLFLKPVEALHCDLEFIQN